MKYKFYNMEVSVNENLETLYKGLYNFITFVNNLIEKEIDSFDLVLFRPDPPVDIDYIVCKLS